RAAGIEVIVTDHHLPGDELPPASAVLDPQRADCRSAAKQLCGTGVAFKLAQALVPALGLSPHLPLHFLDLVALATVADVVPLTGENRILVRHGLKLLAESHWTGVRALVETAGLAGEPIKSGHGGVVPAPPAWWSGMGDQRSASAGKRGARWGAARGGASRASTCTPRCIASGTTSRSTAATPWRRGSPSAGSATRRSVLRFSPSRASFWAPTTWCPPSAWTWRCPWPS